VPREFLGGSRKEGRKDGGMKKLSKSIIKIIFKNNTMIRILAIELSNTILLLVFIIISLIQKVILCPDNFSALKKLCLKGKRSLGTPKRGLEFNVKMNLTDSVDWINLVPNMN
jgi:hypothetical protein